MPNIRFLVFLLLITQGHPVLKLMSLAFVNPNALTKISTKFRPLYFYLLLIAVSIAHGLLYLDTKNYLVPFTISISLWALCTVAILSNIHFISKTAPSTAKSTIRWFAHCILLLSAFQYLQLCISLSTANPFSVTQAAGDYITGTFSFANSNMIICFLLSIFFYYEKEKKLALALMITAGATSFMGGLVVAVASVIVFGLLFEKKIKKKIALFILMTFLFVILFLFSKENIDYALHYLSRTTSLENPPFKIISFIQTTQFLIDSPINFLFGAGPGNFSSRAALIASGSYVNWLPENLQYISKYFQNYHFSIWTNEFGKWDNISSVANQPNSVYNQIAGEYGLTGILILTLTYIFPLLKKWKATPWMQLSLPFIFGILIFDYWFDFIDVIVIFELLVLYELAKLKKTPQESLG